MIIVGGNFYYDISTPILKLSVGACNFNVEVYIYLEIDYQELGFNINLVLKVTGILCFVAQQKYFWVFSMTSASGNAFALRSLKRKIEMTLSQMKWLA